ncbi:MAG: TonB-dependent receptor [Candidatus Omnitrophica bacterium]|nr:TonB-dependent receptor [Candidatus Omnitrophota bacterium]
MKKICFLIYFMLCFSLVAQAEEEKRELVELKRIVITPYKTVVTALLNPSSTDVISVDELNAEGIFTLKGAIEDISSLSYATTGGFGGQTSVFIRGANSYHTQVLLDGIKLYDPIVTSAYFYGYNYMSLDNVERIEVSKGPYSSLYGSDSIGGTINLITRKGEGKPTFSYLQEFGSYQTAQEMLSSEGEIGKLAYSLSTSRTDANAFYSSKYKDGNHERDPYHNLDSSLRLDYALTDDIDIGLLADYTYAKYEYDATSWTPPYLPTDDDDNYAYFYQGIGGINLTHKPADSFFHKIILGYTRTYRKGWESSSSDNWYNSKTYQAKWQGDYQLCDFDKVIFGFDYLREWGEGYWAPIRNPKKIANTKSYYIENIFTPLDNLFLAFSYRLDNHSRFNRHNTYSVSGSYIIEKTNTKIKGSFGQGFKAPSLYQLYSSYGDPNLTPEESESYEVGLEQKLWDSLTIGSTYFHTHLSDLIEYVYPRYCNVGKARIYGIESFFEYLINSNTTLTVSYTHMDTKKLADGIRLTRRPNNKVSCKLKTTFGKLDIYTDLSYVGNRMDGSNKLESYILADMAFNYAVNDKLDAFLRLENILNKDYEHIKGYQTPKFSWYLGANLTF